MVQNVILFEGRLETLDYFSKQMGNAYDIMGLQTFYINLKDEKEYDRLKAILEEKALAGEETMAIGFSFGGLSKEKAVFKEKTGYLWGQYQVPFYNIVCDHPYHFFKKIRGLKEEMTRGRMDAKLYHHVSIDRNHKKFMEKYFKELNAMLFLPLAGSQVMTKEMPTPMKYRKYDILFAGNYTAQDSIDDYLEKLPEEERTLLVDTMDLLKTDSTLLVEEALLKMMKENNPNVTDAEFLWKMEKSVFLDFFVRNYYRGKVVKAIGDYGLPLTIVGMGWDALWEEVPANVTLLPEASSAEVLDLMRQSKICLNVMPWFKDGAHDRIFNAILNGSVSFSDESQYIREELAEGEGLFYYSLDEENKMCKKLSDLLAKPDLLQKKLDLVYKSVLQVHDWGSRAAVLAGCNME